MRVVIIVLTKWRIKYYYTLRSLRVKAAFHAKVILYYKQLSLIHDSVCSKEAAHVTQKWPSISLAGHFCTPAPILNYSNPTSTFFTYI